MGNTTLAAVAVAALASAASASLVTSAWVGPAFSSWELAINWDPAIVPGNGGGNTFAVTIGTPSFVTLGSSPTIDSLTLIPGATLDVAAGAHPVIAVGPIVNNGQIQLHSGSGPTSLMIGADAALQGAGAVHMVGGTQNLLNATVQGARLTNGPSHTIDGAGNIGSGETLLMTNQGLIEATTGSITITLGGGITDNFNVGTIRGKGHNIVFFDNDIDNTGGVIEATDGATVSFTYGSMRGGLLNGVNGGIFVGGSPNGIEMDEFTLNGTLKLLGAQDVGMAGTIVDNGSILMNGFTNNCFLSLVRGASIMGTGVLTGQGANSTIRQYDASVPSVFGPGLTINGAPRFGTGGEPATFINMGTIEATNSTNSIKIQPMLNGGAFVNQGTIRAKGGTVVIFHGNVTNTGGTIIASTGRTVELSSALITGGDIHTEGTGVILCDTNVTGRFADLSLSGNVNVVTTGTVELAGTVTQEGLLKINSSGALVTMTAVGAITLSGGGTFQMIGANARINGSSPPATLTNGPLHTIRGEGRLGDNANISIVNQGTIIADGPTPLVLDVSGSLANSGTIRVAAGQTLTAPPGTWTNTGNILIEPGATLARTGDILQTAGMTTIAGTLSLSGGTLTLAGGTLAGPGSINGNYMQQSGASYAPVVGAAAIVPGQVSITGSAALDGTLHVKFAPGYVPKSGDSFTVMQAASRSGVFSQVVSCQPIQVTYTPTSVIVTLTAGSGVFADLNDDGLVNQDDLAILIGSWGPCSGECCDADLNGDGQVDGRDLGRLLGAWSSPSFSQEVRTTAVLSAD